MKKTLTIMAACAAISLISCKTEMNNPLLTESPLKYEAPVFDKITEDHYLPAFEAAVAEGKKEIEAIVNNPDAPTFENTILELEYAGSTLNRVASIFYNLNEANTSDRMQEIAEQISPMMTEYSLSIMLNGDLFNRVKAVYEQRESLNLDAEQAKLLEKTYKGFADNGANLSAEDKEKYSKIQEELSLATLKFGKNTLGATNAFIMHITKEEDLAGLPVFVKDAAAFEAKSRNLEGWVITLQQPSYSPFMQYSENRELREKLWKAYNSKCIDGEFSNLDIIKQIVGLRIEAANLLGYNTYADMALKDRMAKDAPTVNAFLQNLLNKSLPYAKKDVKAIADYAKAADLLALAARVTTAEGKITTLEGNDANKETRIAAMEAKVSKWDAAEANAKAHADGLNSAMDARVLALEGIDHTKFETAGAAATALSDAKAYTDTEVAKIQSLSEAEIDAAIAAAVKPE